MKRRTIYGIWLLCTLLGCLCSCRERPADNAAFLDGLDAERAVSEALHHIDSIAQYTPDELEPLIISICDRLQQRGDTAAALSVVGFVYGIDPQQRPETVSRLLVSTLLPGKPAPTLVDNEGREINLVGGKWRTILFFYESRCRTCREMMDIMISHYDELTKARVRVITVSCDRDRALFEEYTRKFPWPENLCDFRYYDGPNFTGYGVVNVPAAFVVDEKGIVTGRYGSAEELIDDLLKGKRLGSD